MQPIRRRHWPKIKLFLIVMIGVIIFLSGWKLLSWGQQFKKETGLSATTIASLVLNGGLPLKETNERTNILILGIGGGAHEGSDLTDTMLVISLQRSKRSVAFISIPRDVWSLLLQDKVNSAYHYGEEQKKSGGLILAKTITEDVIGLPMHYGFVIDFSGFTKIIDLVGGVDVLVPKAFTDPNFPIEGKENDPCDGDPLLRCRYEALHFDAGLVHMDGPLALKYVRSRHAEGDEGSDFARSRRQQDVIVALKTKLLTPQILFRPRLAIKLFEAFDQATDTDMNIGELLSVGKLLARIKPEAIKKISIEGELVTPPTWEYGGRFVLVPRDSFPAVHAYIQKELSQ